MTEWSPEKEQPGFMTKGAMQCRRDDRSLRRENKDLKKSVNFQGQEAKVTWVIR